VFAPRKPFKSILITQTHHSKDLTIKSLLKNRKTLKHPSLFVWQRSADLFITLTLATDAEKSYSKLTLNFCYLDYPKELKKVNIYETA
jgi:hypothetical protein